MLFSPLVWEIKSPATTTYGPHQKDVEKQNNERKYMGAVFVMLMLVVHCGRKYQACKTAMHFLWHLSFLSQWSYKIVCLFVFRNHRKTGIAAVSTPKCWREYFADATCVNKGCEGRPFPDISAFILQDAWPSWLPSSSCLWIFSTRWRPTPPSPRVSPPSKPGSWCASSTYSASWQSTPSSSRSFRFQNPLTWKDLPLTFLISVMDCLFAGWKAQEQRTTAQIGQDQQRQPLGLQCQPQP